MCSRAVRHVSFAQLWCRYRSQAKLGFYNPAQFLMSVLALALNGAPLSWNGVLHMWLQSQGGLHSYPPCFLWIPGLKPKAKHPRATFPLQVGVHRENVSAFA